jgi:peptidoglycan/xylan/chitin deacetylase (PgdA/CDA1 family)
MLKKMIILALAATVAFAAPAKANVAITFDDGPQSNYTIAAPILQQYHLPATFYIISGKLGPYWGHVTEDEIRRMAAEGFEIGSHTVNHPDLTTVDPTTLSYELAFSKLQLETILNAPGSVTDFAYPDGATNANVEAACLKVYTTCRGFGGEGTDDPSTMNRSDIQTFGINADVSLDQAKTWIDLGRAPNVLVVLVYHNLANPVPNPWASHPGRFRREMRYIWQSHIPAIPMRALTP